MEFIVIIVMEICKAPTLRFKALNKHSITHIMYIEVENVISNKNVYKKKKTKKLTHNVDKSLKALNALQYKTFMQKCTHMHKMQMFRGCNSGGVYVRCIYSHARCELPKVNQIFVVMFR